MSETIRFEIQQTINLRGVNRMLEYDQRLIRGNSGAHVWRVRVLDGQQDAILAGMTASLYIARQDGKTVHVTEGIEISGNTVRAVLGRDAYEVAGRTLFELDIMQGEETITCATMQANVTQVRTDNLVEPGVGEIYDIDKLMAQIDAMRRATADGERAAGEADDAAQAANTAAGSATSAAGRANAAAAAIEGMTATAQTLDTGAAATASVTVVDGRYQIVLGMPRGLTGATPQITFEVATGEPETDATATVTGTAEAPHILLTIPRGRTGNIGELKINGIAPGTDGSVKLTAESVGARPDTWMPSAKDVGARPDTWTPAIGDIDGLRSAIDNAGGVKTVAGVEPDPAGNVALTAADVGAVAMELLWQNASPSSEMGADADGVNSIELDWAALGCTHVLVMYAYGTSTGNSVNQSSAISKIEIGKRILLSASNAGYDAYANRGLAFADRGLHIGGASSSIAGTKTNGTANAYIIPLKVYGIKGVRTNG